MINNLTSSVIIGLQDTLANLYQFQVEYSNLFYNVTPQYVDMTGVDQNTGQYVEMSIPNWAMLLQLNAGLFADIGEIFVDLNNLSSDVVQIDDSIDNLSANLTIIEEEIANLSSDVFIIDSEITNLSSDVDNLSSDIEIIDSEITNLSSDVSTIDGEITAINNLFSYNPEPDKVPQANSNGNINLGWLNLPPNGLLYYTSSDIYMGTSGGFATYEFDFTNWQEDYLNKVPTANATSDPFYVVPIIQNQYMTVGNSPGMLGSYPIHVFASTKPTYLNGNYYQMQITLGQSDAETVSQSFYYSGSGSSVTLEDTPTNPYSGWQSPPTLHPYSTLGLVAYTIHFLGGPQNVLWNTMPYIASGKLQISCSYPEWSYVEFSCYNNSPTVTYTLNSITSDGSDVSTTGAGSEVAGGVAVLPLTLPPFSMAGGLITSGSAPFTFNYTGSDGSSNSQIVSNILSFNENNIFTIPTSG